MTKEDYFEQGRYDIYYDLVPREKVELDMMEGGVVGSAARDYFYENYATPEQRLKMDLDDKFNNIARYFVWAVTGTFAIIAILKGIGVI